MVDMVRLIWESLIDVSELLKTLPDEAAFPRSVPQKIFEI
jgi:hypothetical protein